MSLQLDIEEAIVAEAKTATLPTGWSVLDPRDEFADKGISIRLVLDTAEPSEIRGDSLMDYGGTCRFVMLGEQTDADTAMEAVRVAVMGTTPIVQWGNTGVQRNRFSIERGTKNENGDVLDVAEMPLQWTALYGA